MTVDEWLPLSRQMAHQPRWDDGTIANVQEEDVPDPDPRSARWYDGDTEQPEQLRQDYMSSEEAGERLKQHERRKKRQARRERRSLTPTPPVNQRRADSEQKYENFPGAELIKSYGIHSRGGLPWEGEL